MICMTYLTFDYFDLNLLDSDIDAFILEGNYVLLMYAESFWLEHTKQGLRNRADLHDLCYVLQKYLDKYVKPKNQCMNEEKPKVVIRDLLPLQEKWPIIYDKLSAIDVSQKQAQFRPHITNGECLHVMSYCFQIIRINLLCFGHFLESNSH